MSMTVSSSLAGLILWCSAFSYSAEPCRLTVNVIDEKGSPSWHTKIILRDRKGIAIKEGFTDLNGILQLCQTDPGKYEVELGQGCEQSVVRHVPVRFDESRAVTLTSNKCEHYLHVGGPVICSVYFKLDSNVQIQGDIRDITVRSRDGKTIRSYKPIDKPGWIGMLRLTADRPLDVEFGLGGLRAMESLTCDSASDVQTVIVKLKQPPPSIQP